MMFGIRLRRRRLIDMFMPREETKQASNPSITSPKLIEISEKFREGIAKAINISPEQISIERVRRWIEEWLKTWVKPEYWSSVLNNPSPLLVEVLGFDIANIIRDARKKKQGGTQ